jgi:hypothetical protein
MNKTSAPYEELQASNRRKDRIRPGAHRILCDGTVCTVCGVATESDELVEVEGVGEELICSRCIFLMIRKLEYSEASRSQGKRYIKGEELLSELRRILGLP